MLEALVASGTGGRFLVEFLTTEWYKRGLRIGCQRTALCWNTTSLSYWLFRVANGVHGARHSTRSAD